MRLGLAIAVLTAALDQLTKWLIVHRLLRPEGVMETPFASAKSIELAPFFDLVVAWNWGVSFGMFNNPDQPLAAWVLPVMTLGICAGLAAWLRKADKPLLRLALGLVIGGALGNLIDRLVVGAVADFLYFHVGSFHWPAFNLADSAISVGAAILIWDSLFPGQTSPKN